MSITWWRRKKQWQKTGKRRQEMIISYDVKAVLSWFCLPFHFYKIFLKRHKKKEMLYVFIGICLYVVWIFSPAWIKQCATSYLVLVFYYQFIYYARVVSFFFANSLSYYRHFTCMHHQLYAYKRCVREKETKARKERKFHHLFRSFHRKIIFFSLSEYISPGNAKFAPCHF